MLLKRLGPVLLLGLALILPALAANAADDPPTITSQVVHSLSAYAQGGSYPMAVSFTIRPGFHINSQRPAEADLYPSKLTWQTSSGITMGPDIFPSPKTYKPSFAAKPMEVHDGVLSVRTTLKVPRDLAPGTYAIKAKLEYQACDDQACLMPDTLEVPITVTVSPAGKPGKPVNPGAFRQTDMPKTPKR